MTCECRNCRIISAKDHAIKKHGPLTRNTSRALHILAEEVGECHQAYLEGTRCLDDKPNPNNLLNELAQVVAMAENIMDNLIAEGL